MKIKTSELTGAALDWAVSLITNSEWTEEDRAFNTYDYVDIGDPEDEPYSPSTDWIQGGPLIEEALLVLSPDPKHNWVCRPYMDTTECYGDTPLIAAMRCFVASHLGSEIEIPEELK